MKTIDWNILRKKAQIWPKNANLNLIIKQENKKYFKEKNYDSAIHNSF